jgi:nickel-dependent lactate racemase
VIEYGGQRVPVSVPEGVSIETVGRRDAGEIDPVAIVETALTSPSEAKHFPGFLQGANRPLVIVNDATRSTPSGAMLAPLLPSLREYSDWRLIVATGLHQAPTEPQLKHLFGDLYPEVRDRITFHDARDKQVLAQMDGSAGSIWQNEAVLRADRIIVLTSVEPHFFAGYTGGRKSFIPGLAGAETIQESHAGAMEAIAVALAVDGNPVRDFIHANTAFIPADRIWALQVVLDRRDRIAAAFAGDIDKTFALACPAARNYYAVQIPEAYDIVLSAVYPPLDISLYQAQKGWEHSLTGVRDGGALIVAAACRDGIGSPFYAELGERYPDPDKWMSLENQPYTMGLHKLVRTARARERVRLMAATGMPAEVVERFGYESHASPDEAVRAAVRHVGTPARMLVVEDGALTTLVRNEQTGT